jgi:hypothetical protein
MKYNDANHGQHLSVICGQWGLSAGYTQIPRLSWRVGKSSGRFKTCPLSLPLFSCYQKKTAHSTLLFRLRLNVAKGMEPT